MDLLRHHRFALHLDLRSYFPSIDLGILRALLAQRIRDAPFLAVIDHVLESGAGLYDDPAARRFARIDPGWPPPGRGLPIGALTSQLFAGHVYLAAFDHFVRRDLKVPGYVRCMDDLYLFGQRRAETRKWRLAAGAWLAAERDLRLKVPRARILSCAGHLDALGHRITRAGIQPHPRTLKRLRSRAARECWVPRFPCRRPDFKTSCASAIGGILFP